MPPVVLAIAGVLEAIGFSAGAALFTTVAILNFGASLVLGEISKLFANSNKPTASSLASQTASRTIVSRQI
jgi:hypothetical protein